MQLCCLSVLTVILLLPIQQGVLYPLVAVHPRHGRGNARAAFNIDISAETPITGDAIPSH